MKKNNLYIVPIEPLENRYTGHWYKYLPDQFKEFCPNYNVYQINAGAELDSTTTSGAFLNFTSTAHYKATQLAAISRLFHHNSIKDGDIFLVTDAWNPCAHMIRYIADLSGIKIHMIGIWHAGHYDSADILNKGLKDKIWANYLEESMYHLYDMNIFATRFHREMFISKVGTSQLFLDKTLVSGFPCEYYDKITDLYGGETKENIILFPHRQSPEKRPQDFEWLRTQLPHFEFRYVQAKTKKEYHAELRKAKYVFSSAEQETLGFSMWEGCLAGCVPIVPDRLSYKEMYPLYYRYSDLRKVPEMIEYFECSSEKYLQDALKIETAYINVNFFNGEKLYDYINNI